jgi:hypothetical protein
MLCSDDAHVSLYIYHLDFTGKAKWDAWKKNEGLSQDEAKQKYIDALLAIFAKTGEYASESEVNLAEGNANPLLYIVFLIHR